MIRRVAAVVASTLALLLPSSVAEAAEGRADESTLVTPVLSVRRVPTLLTGFRAEARLTSALDRVLAEPAVRSVADTSCVAVRVGTRTVYARQADRPVIPASTMKILTGVAALSVLGPDTRLATLVKADSAVRDGEVRGDLQLVGGGDPLLSTTVGAARGPRPLERWTRIEDLAESIVASGVTRITGGVRADETRYDAERTRPGWKPSYLSSGQVGPLGALMVDDGRDTSGAPVANPATHAATVLAGLLRARGVEVRGAVTIGKATGGTEVVRIESLPVKDLVGEMLGLSDNVTAELLVKEMAVAKGQPGTTAAGLRVVRESLAAQGIAADRIEDEDGSGLHRDNRVTCGALAGAVTISGRDGSMGRSMPIAGRTGTLDRRLVGTRAEGRVQAKTGSLDGVSALAGWVDAARASEPPLAFAVVANDAGPFPQQTVLPDRVAVALASWPDAPDPATIGPR